MTVPVFDLIKVRTDPASTANLLIQAASTTVLCDIYMVVILTSDPAPTATDIIAGTGYGGAPVLGSAFITGAFTLNTTITGLPQARHFTTYWVARDNAIPGHVTDVKIHIVDTLRSTYFKFTYATLKTTIQQYMECYEAPFTSMLDTFIATTESRIHNTVNLPPNAVEYVFVARNGYANLNLTHRMLHPIALRLMTTPTMAYLQQKEATYLLEMYPSRYGSVAFAGGGDPAMYALQADSKIIFRPFTTDVNYTFILDYYADYDSIIDPTNDDHVSWLSERFPHVLLYGALVEAAVFNKSDPSLYETMFQRQLAMLKVVVDGKNQQDQYRKGAPRVAPDNHTIRVQ